MTPGKLRDIIMALKTTRPLPMQMEDCPRDQRCDVDVNINRSWPTAVAESEVRGVPSSWEMVGRKDRG
jgi:hypothetical protein